MWARNRWFFILVDIFCFLNFCLFSRRPSAFQRHDDTITFSLNRVFVFWNILWHFFIKVADLIVRLMKRGFVWARTDKNRRKFHVNIYKACRYYYKNNLRSVKLSCPLKLFYSTYFWKYLFVFVFIEVNVRGQVKRAFELNALFLQIHSSGSLWLLNALFVITDLSRGMDWPWCYCFVKETTLCAPTLNLWLTQSYILTHARAFNIKRAASYDWN